MNSVRQSAIDTNTCFETPIDVKQAAAFLSVHHKTIEKFSREGRIPAHRIGNLWRFYRSELDAWLKGTVTLQPAKSVRVN
jgi:excisionase family DNA binding protein